MTAKMAILQAASAGGGGVDDRADLGFLDVGHEVHEEDVANIRGELGGPFGKQRPLGLGL